MPARDGNGRSAEWLRPRLEQQGLQRYVNTIRERIKLILLITVLTTGAAVAYVVTAHKEYTAEATCSDTLGLPERPGLPGPRADPQLERSHPRRRDRGAAGHQPRGRACRPSATFVPEARARFSLQQRVTAEPVAQSNLVAVTATGHTAGEARTSPTASRGRHRDPDREAAAPRGRSSIAALWRPACGRSARRTAPRRTRWPPSTPLFSGLAQGRSHAPAPDAGRPHRPVLAQEEAEHRRGRAGRPHPRNRQRVRAPGARSAPAPRGAAAGALRAADLARIPEGV